MKIHKLSFVIANPEVEEEYPQFRVTINGLKETFGFLILPLELSAKQDGLYPILTCSCGDWGCGGYYVGIKNTEEHVIWEGVYGDVNPTKKTDVLSTTVPIYFLRKEYEALINELLILKDKYKWEANVYKVDKEQYDKGGLESLEYIREFINFIPMTTTQKKESLHLFEQIVDGKITYNELMKSLPKNFNEDSDIMILLDMVQHWPAETTILGGDNMKEYKEHEKMIREYLDKAVNNVH